MSFHLHKMPDLIFIYIDASRYFFFVSFDPGGFVTIDKPPLGFWLLTVVTFFTLDSSFHQYYMTELAPGLSAMVGIGLVTMWGDYRARGWRGRLLPLALAVTAGAQIYMLASFPSWASWLD